MKLLLLNQDWFANELKQLGHEVVTCGFKHHLDVELTVPLADINDIIADLPGGFRPDCILIHDDSSPFLLSGLEECDIPRVFYSVDAHHHARIHRLFAGCMDHSFLAQADYKTYFEEVGARVSWLPLWASKQYSSSTQKDYQAVFVGNMNPKLNPERVQFFEALMQKVPLECLHGEFWNIFPFSHIVMNQTVKGDLNFRVFEAMMSGSLLLTEYSENGLTDLFIPDSHLLLYEKGNVQQAADIVSEYLSKPERCREIGMAGREQVLSKHLAKHRVVQILNVIEGLQPQKKERLHFSLLANYEWLVRRFHSIQSPFTAVTARVAFEILKKGLRAGESLSEELSWFVVYIALEYKRQTGDSEAEVVLGQLAEAYSNLSIFRIAEIWSLLNRGESKLAQEMTIELYGGVESTNVNEAYSHFNEVVMSVMGPEERDF